MIIAGIYSVATADIKEAGRPHGPLLIIDLTGGHIIHLLGRRDKCVTKSPGDLIPIYMEKLKRN